jgi:hypothetical protein
MVARVQVKMWQMVAAANPSTFSHQRNIEKRWHLASIPTHGRCLILDGANAWDVIDQRIHRSSRTTLLSPPAGHLEVTFRRADKAISYEG